MASYDDKNKVDASESAQIASMFILAAVPVVLIGLGAMSLAMPQKSVWEEKLWVRSENRVFSNILGFGFVIILIDYFTRHSTKCPGQCVFTTICALLGGGASYVVTLLAIKKTRIFAIEIKEIKAPRPSIKTRLVNL